MRVAVTLPLHVKYVSCAGYNQKKKTFRLDEDVLWYLTLSGSGFVGGMAQKTLPALQGPCLTVL